MRIRLGICPTHTWDSEENICAGSLQRQADVYVFCVVKHKEQETLNLLDVDQWEYYTLSTEVLSRGANNQKTISLHHIISLGASKNNFAGLNKAIHQQYIP